MRRRRLLGLVLALPAALHAQSSAVPAVSQLPAVAADSRARGVPIILFFSTPGCPYCREVRTSYLAPRLGGGLLVREVDITSRDRLTGFDGRLTTPAALAERYGVTMVPVVLAVDARGAPLGPPLVGLDRAGFYDALLQRLLDDAARQVAR
jgi:thioredoxin-related protein